MTSMSIYTTLLVDRDASLDAVDVVRHYCLHLAAFFDRLDICLYLIINGKGFDPAALNQNLTHGDMETKPFNLSQLRCEEGDCN